MRILHILDHSLPLHSGYAFRTVCILREQRRLGWETRALTTPRQGRASQQVDEASEWHFDRTVVAENALSALPWVRYLQEMKATARRIVEVAADFRPDILHAHSPVLAALPSLWAGRKLGLPVVYEVRALWEDAAVDHGTAREGSARYRVSRALETLALSRADRITTICEGLRGEIGARGIARERITVVPNAVDASEFPFATPPDEELRRRLGLSGMTVVGFAGSFYAYEGIDLLIEAASSLAPARPDLRLLLIGGGPQEARLRAMAAERGISGRVVFTGRVPHAEMPRYYGIIDVLAYPRRRMRLTELVTPLKPLEAMAMGRLFVASDVGGHRELVRDGETGFLFPAGDAPALARAIAALLERTADWPRLRETARRYVESERTWARSVARYAAVYDALASKAPAEHMAPDAQSPGKSS
jgi:PEP-CTERM/exosortase A-associated glycosyltransferase